MAKQPATSRSEDPPPKSFAETPASYTANHDWTLQIVMEMQKTLGGLDAKMDRAVSDVDKVSKQVDQISHRMAWVAGGAAAVGAIIGLLVAVLAVLPKLQVSPVPVEPAPIVAPAAASTP